MSEINLRCFFSCFRARTKPSNAEMQQMKQVMLFAAELWFFSAKIHQQRILTERIQITQTFRVPKVTYPKINEEASKEQQPDNHWHSLPFVEMSVSCLHYRIYRRPLGISPREEKLFLEQVWKHSRHSNCPKAAQIRPPHPHVTQHSSDLQPQTCVCPERQATTHLSWLRSSGTQACSSLLME